MQASLPAQFHPAHKTVSPVVSVGDALFVLREKRREKLIRPPAGVQVDPLQMMMNATDLSTERYHDFSLVFD